MIIRTTSLTNNFLFFFNVPATTEIYTLSLHDALPISVAGAYVKVNCQTTTTGPEGDYQFTVRSGGQFKVVARLDRKSTRLNSSHPSISYAVFCLKKKTRMD